MAQITKASPATVTGQPLVQFGREVCGDLVAGLRREWLVTNGLGGYASSTVTGINTRRYHGLLVAALTPPVERTVLVGGLVEWATYDGQRYPLSTHAYIGGTIDPQGYRYIQPFSLQGTLPVWTYALRYTFHARYDNGVADSDEWIGFSCIRAGATGRVAAPCQCRHGAPCCSTTTLAADQFMRRVKDGDRYSIKEGELRHNDSKKLH